jgi:hypothetical protein
VAEDKPVVAAAGKLVVEDKHKPAKDKHTQVVGDRHTPGPAHNRDAQ